MDLVGGGSVNLILQSERYFLLVDNVRGIQVFTYEGKLVSNPRLATLRPQLLKQGNISLSDDVLAVIDRTNPKCKLIHPRFSYSHDLICSLCCSGSFVGRNEW
jgi:intraflagellar transport protein 80